MMTFIGRYNSCSESSEEDILAEELYKTYRELLTEWRGSFLRKEKPNKIISTLLMERDKLGLTIDNLEEKSHCQSPNLTI